MASLREAQDALAAAPAASPVRIGTLWHEARPLLPSHTHLGRTSAAPRPHLGHTSATPRRQARSAIAGACDGSCEVRGGYLSGALCRSGSTLPSRPHLRSTSAPPLSRHALPPSAQAPSRRDYPRLPEITRDYVDRPPLRPEQAAAALSRTVALLAAPADAAPSGGPPWLLRIEPPLPLDCATARDLRREASSPSPSAASAASARGGGGGGAAGVCEASFFSLLCGAGPVASRLRGEAVGSMFWTRARQEHGRRVACPVGEWSCRGAGHCTRSGGRCRRCSCTARAEGVAAAARAAGTAAAQSD